MGKSGRIVWCAVVAVSLLCIGWLATQVAVVRSLPATAGAVLTLAPNDPRTTLDRLTQQITSAKAPPPAAAYAPLAAAAANLPLDDRPFLLSAIQALADGHESDGVRLLEEARRRNPRQRFVRLLLLDRYLRADRVGEAVTEMAVLNRLLPAGGGVLSAALAKFAADPAVSGQTRRALADDPTLLNTVLVAMAPIASPAVVIRFAGANAPSGLESAGWRTALINAMVARNEFADARRLWMRSHRVDPANAASPIYNASLQATRGGPPFGWSLAANEIGAAEVRGGAFAIEYYGRRSGPLASQLVVLPPGRYRFAYAVAGSGGDDDGGLAWTLACRGESTSILASVRAGPLRPTARAVAAEFTVPADGCPAQMLNLEGLAGEFSGSVSARITHLTLDRLS